MGVEPMTFWNTVGCFNPLSYGRLVVSCHTARLKYPTGIVEGNGFDSFSGSENSFSEYFHLRMLLCYFISSLPPFFSPFFPYVSCFILLLLSNCYSFSPLRFLSISFYLPFFLPSFFLAVCLCLFVCPSIHSSLHLSLSFFSPSFYPSVYPTCLSVLT